MDAYRQPSDDAVLEMLQRYRRTPDPRTTAYLDAWLSAHASGAARARDEPDAEALARLNPSASPEYQAALQVYQSDVNSRIRPPTPHENRGHYSTVQTIASRLDEAIAGFDRWRVRSWRPPVFGLTDLRRARVRSIRVPSTSDDLLLVDAELMTHMWLFSKAVAVALPTEPVGGGAIGVSIGGARSRVGTGAAARFRDVVLACVLSGRASAAGDYRLRDDGDERRIASMLVSATEVFVLAHAYVHLLERNVADGMTCMAGPSAVTESVTDDLALELSATVIRQESADNAFLCAYWGADLVLRVEAMLLEAVSLLRSGQPTAGLHDAERARHQVLVKRRTTLYELMRRRVGLAGLGPTELEENLSVMTHVADVIDALWEGVAPVLRRGYVAGQGSAAVWDGLG